MNSNSMVFSERLKFLKRWLPLLLLGILMGGIVGFLLKSYASKTTYSYSVGIEVSHPDNKKYEGLRLSDVQNASQYSVLVKSSGVLDAVNTGLRTQHGININKVDLAQMYNSGSYKKEGTFFVSCTSTSSVLAKQGLDVMTKQIKNSIQWADTRVNVRVFSLKNSAIPKAQSGNKNVLFYAPIVGLFVAMLASILIDWSGKKKGKSDAVKS